MKRALVFLLLTLFAVVSPQQVWAVVNPLEVPNNKFGIHIIDRNDFKPAAELVNSNGGEWGYVTLVIREDQRDVAMWQEQFDELRELKLIPLVRLATRMEDTSWKAPSPGDAREWAEFLNQLNWVVQNRYVILFNEPNHAKEWGGRISPEEFVEVLNAFDKELKAASDDFFVLPGALDLAPETTADTMHPREYYEAMHQADQEIFKIFEGWASHSYPNPAFSGSVYSSGRNSVRGFEWELELLEPLGLNPDIPIFITETGWIHNQGLPPDRSALATEVIGENLRTAYTQIWDHPSIVAVTPFVLNYQAFPFDNFSWLEQKTQLPHAHYRLIQAMEKTAGEPQQRNNSSLAQNFFPKELIVDSKVSVAMYFTNTGQTIWDPQDTNVLVTDLTNGITQTNQLTRSVKPNDVARVWVDIHPPSKPGEINYTIQLVHKDKPFGEVGSYEVIISEETNWRAKLRLWFDKLTHREDLLVSVNQRLQTFKLQISNLM